MGLVFTYEYRLVVFLRVLSHGKTDRRRCYEVVYLSTTPRPTEQVHNAAEVSPEVWCTVAAISFDALEHACDFCNERMEHEARLAFFCCCVPRRGGCFREGVYLSCSRVC